MFARGEYSHRNRQFYTAPGGRLQLILLDRNLADAKYVTSTAGFPTGTVGRVGEPRTYALRAIARY